MKLAAFLAILASLAAATAHAAHAAQANHVAGLVRASCVILAALAAAFVFPYLFGG